MSPVKRHAQSRLLQATAERLGVAVEDKSAEWGRDALVLTHGGVERVVLLGRVDASLSYLAYQLTVDKWVTKRRLADFGVPTPDGVRFRFDPDDPTAADRDALLAAWPPALGAGDPWVCKPQFGEYGCAVGMNLRAPEHVLHHLALHGREHADWVLERQIAGKDVRIHAIGGELVAACVREPALVTADGVRSVRDLAAAHDEAVRKNNPDNRLIIDDETMAVLAAQGLALEDRPPAGTRVALKLTANMAKGGRAVDLTDALHPSFRDWVGKTAKAFGLEVFSLDVICSDPAAPADEGAVVLEVNAEPDWLHHTFSDGRRHDMAAIYLRFLFPSLTR